MKTTWKQEGKQWIYGLFAVMAFAILFCLNGNTIISHAETTITVNESAKVRSEASTDSTVIGSAASGSQYSVAGEVTGADGKVWYQVSVNGQTGYIRSDLATKGDGQAAAPAQDNFTETAATVTPSSASAGTVTSDCNVRKGPSTTDAKVTGVKSGEQVEITGEATGADGKTWYQVSVGGKEGFIRSDLLEVSASEETGDGEEGQESDSAAEESEVPETDESSMQISNVISSRILPGDTNLEDMVIDESTLAEWESGKYYVLYTQNDDGNDSWYLYSLEDNQFERINNLKGDDEESSGGASLGMLDGKGKIFAIAAIIIIVILLIACVIMAVKLHEYSGYEYIDEDEDDDDDDEYEDDEDDEDDEEDEEDDEEEDEEDEPVRKKKNWKPKNFLARRAKDEYEDEDEDDEEYDEEEDEDEEEDGDEEYLDDDDFEFEFLNMDDKKRR